jgi:hypothetical protein
MPRGKKTSLEEFAEKSREVHGDRYDYIEIIYSQAKYPKVIIVFMCIKHNTKCQQNMVSHFGGFEYCPKCIMEIKTKEFIEDAILVHGDEYDYSLVEYINETTKVKIMCEHHGIFEQTPQGHIKKKEGCSKCATEKRTGTLEQFIDKAHEIHENKYDYSLAVYVNSSTKLKIICPRHTIFEQTPNQHLRDHGCSKCPKAGFSKKQIEWLNYLAKKDDIYIQHAMNDGELAIGKYKVDGYCKKTNTVYEFNGDIWHGNLKIFKPSAINPINKKTFGELYIATLQKQLYIESKGYNLITIWEDEWNQLKRVI